MNKLNNIKSLENKLYNRTIFNLSKISNDSYFYDLIIIGAGAAGLASAIFFKELNPSSQVLLLEASDSCGRKILLSGGGRCNILNLKNESQLPLYYYEASKFVSSIFSRYNSKYFFDYFVKNNLHLKIEDNDRVFPSSDDSAEVLLFFMKSLEKYNIDLLLNSEALSFHECIKPLSTTLADGSSSSCLLYPDDTVVKVDFRHQGRSRQIQTKALLLCIGSPAYYSQKQAETSLDILMKKSKYSGRIKEFSPALTYINLNKQYEPEKELCSFTGLSLPEATLSIFNNNKKICSFDQALLFTHNGLSGPLAQDISRYIYSKDFLAELDAKDVVYLNFPKNSVFNYDTNLLKKLYNNLYQYQLNEVELLMQTYFNENFKIDQIKINDFLTDIYSPEVMKITKLKNFIFKYSYLSLPILSDKIKELIPLKKYLRDLSKKEFRNLADNLWCGFALKLKLIKGGCMPIISFSQAKSAKGGIDLNCIVAKEMRLKDYQKIYACGECLDIDARCGGYSFTAHFACAKVAADAINSKLYDKGE